MTPTQHTDGSACGVQTQEPHTYHTPFYLSGTKKWKLRVGSSFI